MTQSKDISWIVDFGCELLSKGSTGKALEIFQRASHLAPKNPIILNNMGNALQYLNRLDEAEETYQQAIAVSPNYLKPYRNLALLYQLQGRTDKSIASYRNYLDCVSDDGEAHHNLGLLYISKGFVNNGGKSP